MVDVLYKFETSDCRDIKTDICVVDTETLDKYCLTTGEVVSFWEINKLFHTPEKMYMYAYVNDINVFYRKLFYLLSLRLEHYQDLCEDTENKWNIIKGKLKANSVKYYSLAVE